MRVRKVYFNFVWDHMCIGLIWDAMGFGTYFIRVIMLGCMLTFDLERKYVRKHETAIEAGVHAHKSIEDWLDAQMEEEGLTHDED